MKNTTSITEQIDAAIKRVGWMVQGVFTGPNTPDFAYTVGLAAKGLPELIIFGLPQEVAMNVLNALARKLVSRESVLVGTPINEVFEGCACMLIEADRENTDEYMYQAKYRYPDYQALQVFWPDDKHHWPWEEAYNKAYPQPQLRRVLH